MALLAAVRRASALPLRRAPALLRRRPTLSSAWAMSFQSSSSSSSEQQQDEEDPFTSLYRDWATMRDLVDTTSATLQEFRLGRALGSAVARAPAADLPSLRAQIEETTDYFPFEISEKKRGDDITLTRAMKGEQIKVVVSMPSRDDDDDDDEMKNESSSSSSDKNTKENEEGETDTSRSAMHLIVTVSKSDGSNLNFACFAYPEKVEIITMNMEPPTTKEAGEDDHDMDTYDGFEDLDENLQKSFHEYLELRGITPKMMNLLRGYLSSKLQRKHTLWLNKVQEFVMKTEPEAA